MYRGSCQGHVMFTLIMQRDPIGQTKGTTVTKYEVVNSLDTIHLGAFKPHLSLLSYACALKHANGSCVCVRRCFRIRIVVRMHVVTLQKASHFFFELDNNNICHFKSHWLRISGHAGVKCTSLPFPIYFPCRKLTSHIRTHVTLTI